MALFGGGNPISVAANFRLVFDTRSYTRTASAYDAAMSKLVSKGSAKVAQNNKELAAEHEQLLRDVEENNKQVQQDFLKRSRNSTNQIIADARRGTEFIKLRQKLQKGHAAGLGISDMRKTVKEYERALKEMGMHAQRYHARMRNLGIDTMDKYGAFSPQKFEQLDSGDRQLAIEDTEALLRYGELEEQQRKEILVIQEQQLRIHAAQLQLERMKNGEVRKGKRAAKESGDALAKAHTKGEIALRQYKQQLMEANMLVSQMSSQIQMGLTQALMTSTIALIGFGYKLQQIISDFQEFEQELRNANSIWQETNATLYTASDTILEFGSQYGIGLQGATEGLYQMASAGLSAEEATSILNDTLKLSMAVQGDHETLAKLTIQTIKGFGLEMSQSAELTDKMAHAINKSLIEWNDLASAVKFAMPFFVSMNQEVDQLFGALQILTDRALEAGIAGRGLRQAIAQFAKHADDNTAAFKRMGVQVQDNEGNFLQLTEIAKNFSDKFGEAYSEVEQMTTLLEDLNVRGATAFVHLVQNADEFQAAVDDLANSQGAAAKMADMQNISLTNQIQIMKNAAAAAFFASDASYEHLNAMNELDYLIKTAVSDFRDFAFVQTETGLVLSENGELIKSLLLGALRELIFLARHAYQNFERFAGEGDNLAEVIHALAIPMKVAVTILGMLGEGGLQAIVMYKIMNALIPMNSLLMIANQQATIASAEADGIKTGGLGKLAAAQGAANMLMFAGFVMMNKSGEAAQKFGQILVGLAGAYYGVAIARSMATTPLPVPLQIAAGVAGAAAMVAFANLMKSTMKVEPMDYTPVAWEGYGDVPTMDSGGTIYNPGDRLPWNIAGGGFVRGTHSLALLEAGEQVIPRTQAGSSGGINIFIQGDVYDGDNFARTVADALPNALGKASGTGSLDVQTKIQGSGLGRRAVARTV